MFYPGAIEKYDSRDYLLGAEWLDLAKISDNTFKTYEAYNQAQVQKTRMYCTIFATCTAIAYNCGEKISYDEVVSLWDSQVDKGLLDESLGAYVIDSVKAGTKKYNKNFYRTETKSKEFYDMLKKGYCAVIGYKYTKDMINDSQDDGIVQGEYDIGNGGHCVCAVLENGKVKIIDSYKGRLKYNEYILEKFNESDILFSSAYFIINKPMEKIFLDVDAGHPFYEQIKWLKESGITNGYPDGTFKPNQTVTRGEMAVFLKRLYERR